MEEMCTTAPDLAAIISGSSPRSRRTAASRFRFSSACHCPSLSAAKPPDVEGAQSGTDLVEDRLGSAGGAEVSGDEQVTMRSVVRHRAGGGHHGRAGLA